MLETIKYVLNMLITIIFYSLQYPWILTCHGLGTKTQVWTSIKDTDTKVQLIPVLQPLFPAYNSLYLGNTHTGAHMCTRNEGVSKVFSGFSFSFCVVFGFCAVLEFEHEACSSVTDNCSTPELHPHSKVWHFKIGPATVCIRNSHFLIITVKIPPHFITVSFPLYS